MTLGPPNATVGQDPAPGQGLVDCPTDKSGQVSSQKQHHVCTGSLSPQFGHDRWEGYPQGVYSRFGRPGFLRSFSGLHLGGSGPERGEP